MREDAGVFVILGMHQDVYGRRDTAGRALGFNGAPQWATITDDEPFRYDASNWACDDFQAAVLRAFDHSWDYDQGPHPGSLRLPVWRERAPDWAGAVEHTCVIPLARMRKLFPDGEVFVERRLGFEKSCVLYRPA